jgi:hypothetical protein
VVDVVLRDKLIRGLEVARIIASPPLVDAMAGADPAASPGGHRVADPDTVYLSDGCTAHI